MKKRPRPIVFPDSTSDEIQAGEKPATEVEGHAEACASRAAWAGMVLPCDSLSGLVGDVAGQLEILLGFKDGIGEPETEGLAHRNQIGLIPLLVEYFNGFDADAAGVVGHA